MHKNFVKFRRVVSEICERTDRQTDRQTDKQSYTHRNTLLASWERSK